MNYILQCLQTILVVSVIIGVVWLLGQLLGKKAGYRWRKILWIVLAIRLLVPISVPVSELVDSFRGLEIEVTIPTEMQVTLEGKEQSESDMQKIASTGKGMQVYEEGSGDLGQKEVSIIGNVRKSPSGNKLSLAGGIFLAWGVGAVGMLIFRGLQYGNMKKKCFGETVLCEDPVILEYRKRLCDELNIQKEIPIREIEPTSGIGNSPMLFGYFHTVLLLPDNAYDSQEIEAIMRHELTHYCAKDLWYKLLLMVVCDIYWFNPLFRLMKKMAFTDVEYVCDEKVTASLDLDAKKKYSSTILKTMSGAKGVNLVFATRFAGNKKSAKERFENIFAVHNRKVGIAVLCSLILVIVVGTAFISVTVLKEDEGIVVANEPEQLEKEPEEAQDSKVITIDAAVLSENTETLLGKLGENYPEYEISVADAEFSYREEKFYEQTPTLFQVDNAYLHTLEDAGKIADITDALTKRGWQEQMDGALRTVVSDEDGRVYGIPLPSFYAYGLMVNAQLFEEAGLVDEQGVPLIPTTWEELAQTAVKIKEATGSGFCLLAKDYAGSVQFCNIAWNFGATRLATIEEDGSYKAHLDSEAAIEAMEFVKALKWEYDVLTTDPLQEDFMTGFEHLADGSVAMYLGANDVVSIPISYGMPLENIALGAVPAGPNGEQYSLCGGSVIVFSADATSEQIDVGLTLLELMGLGPVANDSGKNRIQEKLQKAVEQGIPTIPEIPVWHNADLLDYEQSVIAEKGNVNQSFYQPYYDKIITPGNLKGEDIAYPAFVYDELFKVLRGVIINQDADVAQLMKTANDNLQRMMDSASASE